MEESTTSEDSASVAEDSPTFQARLAKLHSDPAVAKKIYKLAAEVFTNLSEVQYMVNVQFQYVEELKLLYLTARNLSSLSEDKIFVPMIEEQLTSTWLNSMLNHLTKDKKDKSVILAMQENDSTVSYLMIAEGLALPFYTGTPEDHERQERNFLQAVSLLGYSMVPDNASIQLPYTALPSKDSPPGSVMTYASLQSLLQKHF